VGVGKAADHNGGRAHPGVISLSGDTATCRAYLSELTRIRGGASHLDYAIYDDR
jgi:hypothetical protein